MLIIAGYITSVLTDKIPGSSIELLKARLFALPMPLVQERIDEALCCVLPFVGITSFGCHTSCRGSIVTQLRREIHSRPSSGSSSPWESGRSRAPLGFVP